MLKLSLLMTLRDWRAGELRFLMVALALAVASLSAVQFFADRMGTGLRRDAHQLLAADLRLMTENAPDPAWRTEALKLGLQVSDTVEMPSMAMSGAGDAVQAQLVALKAVGSGYPLRGSVMLRQGESTVAAKDVPRPGTAWVDDKTMSSLKIARGATIRVGDTSYVVEQVIAAEPDRPAAVAFQPRVMIALPDLAATGLGQPGSFARHALLVAGDKKGMADFEAWLKPVVEKSGARGSQIDTLASRSEEVSEALARADNFLSLVALLSAVLASVAIAMAARRYTDRHADASAMLKCLGLRQSKVTAMYLIEFTMVGLVASAIGVACGFAAHFVLLEWLGSLVTTELPAPSWWPILNGLGVGTLLLVGFGVPPLLQLRNVSHNRLLRREAESPKPATLAAYGMGLLVFCGLLLWQTGDLKVGLISAGAFIAGMALFALVAWATIACLRFLPAAFDKGVWRLALADTRRRPVAAITQIVALALGLMALLLLTVVRGDLLDAWKNTAPPNAPNQAVVRIEAAQREAVQARLRQFGNPELFPRMLARIQSVNGKKIDPADHKEGLGKHIAQNQVNVSSFKAPPPSDTLLAGRWFAGSAPELSVSENAAKALKLKLGDRVAMDFAGSVVELPVTSLRKIDRQARMATFSFIVSASVAEGKAATYETNFHVPPTDKRSMTRLAEEFPNLVIVNFGAIMDLVQSVLDQVSAAIEFLFLFTLASGVLVLYATLLASQNERMRQSALLRALGASRSQLSKAQHIEYAMIGALAGLLAASGACAASWALSRFVFKFAWEFPPLLIGAGIVAGALCSLLGGWAGLRAILNHPPLQSLRTN
ncbi:MAG: FtsX-like permease family protein [Pseudomonadota bacterium]